MDVEEGEDLEDGVGEEVEDVHEEHHPDHHDVLVPVQPVLANVPADNDTLASAGLAHGAEPATGTYHLPFRERAL